MPLAVCTTCTVRDTPKSTQCGFSGTISMREEQVGRSMCSEAGEYRNRWRLGLGGCRGRWAKGRARGSAGLWEDRWWRGGSLRLLYSVWDQVGPRRHLPTPPPSAGNDVTFCRVWICLFRIMTRLLRTCSCQRCHSPVQAKMGSWPPTSSSRIRTRP